MGNSLATAVASMAFIKVPHTGPGKTSTSAAIPVCGGPSTASDEMTTKWVASMPRSPREHGGKRSHRPIESCPKKIAISKNSCASRRDASLRQSSIATDRPRLFNKAPIAERFETSDPTRSARIFYSPSSASTFADALWNAQAKVWKPRLVIQVGQRHWRNQMKISEISLPQKARYRKTDP